MLLAVRYSGCHWCHVMSHEGFESPAIAAVMNERSVNIKSDRGDSTGWSPEPVCPPPAANASRPAATT
jgi:hypothetical protein